MKPPLGVTVLVVLTWPRGERVLAPNYHGLLWGRRLPIRPLPRVARSEITTSQLLRRTLDVGVGSGGGTAGRTGRRLRLGFRGVTRGPKVSVVSPAPDAGTVRSPLNLETEV
jgi:hypothetical protein